MVTYVDPSTLKLFQVQSLTAFMQLYTLQNNISQLYSRYMPCKINPKEAK